VYTPPEGIAAVSSSSAIANVTQIAGVAIDPGSGPVTDTHTSRSGTDMTGESTVAIPIIGAEDDSGGDVAGGPTPKMEHVRLPTAVPFSSDMGIRARSLPPFFDSNCSVSTSTSASISGVLTSPPDEVQAHSPPSDGFASFPDGNIMCGEYPLAKNIISKLVSCGPWEALRTEVGTRVDEEDDDVSDDEDDDDDKSGRDNSNDRPNEKLERADTTEP
jgi:hypothetical protein